MPTIPSLVPSAPGHPAAPPPASAVPHPSRNPRTRPNLPAARLAIEGAMPLPGEYAPGSFGQRYWSAADTLTRGAAVWHAADLYASVWHATAQAPFHWHGGGTLRVHLDIGATAHTIYDRASLRFVARPAAPETPATLCHPLGHAVLDAMRPDLWDAASDEVAAFHDTFADLTTVLVALERHDQRAAILAGRASLATALANLAGLGLRTRFGEAMLDMVVALASVERGMRGRNTDAALLGAGRKAARLLATAVRRVPVVPNFLAQMSAELAIAAAVQEGPAMATRLRTLFAGHLLLAPVTDYDPHESGDGTEIPLSHPAPLPLVAIDATRLGLHQPLLLRPASQTPRLAVEALSPGGVPLAPPHPVTAARAFAADLIAAGRIASPRRNPGATTHRLVDDGRTLVLERICFRRGAQGRWRAP